MEEQNRIEDWHKTEKRLCWINKELTVKVNLLTGEVPVRFYKSDGSNSFTVYPDFKEFIILSFSDVNDRANYASVCFGIDQFIEFLDFLEGIYNNWFKLLSLKDGIPEYKAFVYNENKGAFIIRSEYKYARKRFNNTCNKKIIEIRPYTYEEDNSPKVGITIAFGDGQYTFIKKTSLISNIKMLKNIDYYNYCLNLFNLTISSLNSPFNVKRNEDTMNQMSLEVEKSKIKLITSKKNLYNYCKTNKIAVSKEDFENNSLEDLKEAVINYVSETEEEK